MNQGDNYEIWNTILGSPTVSCAEVPVEAGYAVQLVWTGNITGTFYLECSCDSPTSFHSPTNWDVIEDTDVSAGGAPGSFTYNVRFVQYKWMRLTYDGDSGSGTVVARINMRE